MIDVQVILLPLACKFLKSERPMLKNPCVCYNMNLLEIVEYPSLIELVRSGLNSKGKFNASVMVSKYNFLQRNQTALDKWTDSRYTDRNV